MNKKNIKNRMRRTWQIEDKLSVLDHGLMVYDKTQKIIQMLKNNNDSQNFVIPECLRENSTYLLNNLVDKRTLFLYTVYHDCGKPFCEPDH